jgi:hypothetical protein
MGRFDRTTESVKQLAQALSALPGAVPSNRPQPASNNDDLVKRIVDVMQREDYNAIKVALLCDKLITKYKGRAV